MTLGCDWNLSLLPSSGDACNSGLSSVSCNSHYQYLSWAAVETRRETAAASPLPRCESGHIYIGRSGLCKQPQPAGTLPLPGCLFLLLHFTFCHFSWTQYCKAHGFFFMWLKQFHITKKHGNDFLEIHGAVKSSLSLAFAFVFAHRRENSATTKE